jgi:hypothetical protein
MPDYTKASNKGTLTIHDTGSLVEFYVQAGYSNFSYHLTFEIVANGTTTKPVVAYPNGMPKIKVGSATVTTSQTVKFNLLTQTGTQSMGGPTYFSVFLDRGSVPAAPVITSVTPIDDVSVRVVFKDGANGGFAIDSRQVGYGTNANAPQTYVPAGLTQVISGLTRNTKYYFWARTHNQRGWGPLSARKEGYTLGPPMVPTISSISSITQYSAIVTLTSNGDGGSPITQYEIATSSDPNVKLLITKYKSAPTMVGPLDPGRQVYFWARATNALGTSAWSAPQTKTTRAGAMVRTIGVQQAWSKAVPYIYIGGEWKLAKPYVYTAGTWKETN